MSGTPDHIPYSSDWLAVVMTREGVGEVFREPSKKDAISRAHEIASASGHPCVVVTHHENGIAERKSFG